MKGLLFIRLYVKEITLDPVSLMDGFCSYGLNCLGGGVGGFVGECDRRRCLGLMVGWIGARGERKVRIACFMYVSLAMWLG